MMHIRKSMLAVVIAGAGFAGMAQAGSLVGNGVTAQADLVFVESSAITNTLTPEKGLRAGKIEGNVNLASGVVASKDNKSMTYAVTFNNGEVSATPNNRPSIYLSGKNNAENKLRVYMLGAEGDSHDIINGKNYVVSKEPSNKFTYSVNALYEQTIAADTYTLATIAYMYTN